MTVLTVLTARGPVSAARAAAFVAAWPATASERPHPDGVLRLAFVRDDLAGSAAVAVRQSGSDAVEVETASTDNTVDGTVDGTAGAPDAALVVQLRRILGLDLDGDGFAALAGRDPHLAALVARAPGLRPVLFASPYEAAAWAVLSARTAAANATGLRRRLMLEHGDAHDVRGVIVRSFPVPRRLLEVDVLPGAPAEKLRRLHGVAEAALDGRLDVARLAALDHPRLLAELKTVRGIGDFYAELIAVRALPGRDVPPTAEPRLLAAAGALFGRPVDGDEFRELTAGWSPHRSWAAFLLRAT